MQQITQYSDFSFSGIYAIKNSENGKIYVGSSDNICKRIYTHNRDLNANKHHSIHLQRAWNKYGAESFLYFCIEKCDVELLIEREQKWMDDFCSYKKNKGYNISPTAGSCRGIKLSEEHKEKLSKAHTGKKISEETKQKLSDIHKANPFWKGKHHSEETKQKIVEAKIGVVQSKETADKRNSSIRQGGSRAGTSQYKGVSWYSKRGKWISQIKINRKNIRVGQFDDEILAAKNYDYHTRKIDATAYLNFPDEDYSAFQPKRKVGL